MGRRHGRLHSRRTRETDEEKTRRLTAKVEALKTLLPLLESHVELAPGAARVPNLDGVKGGEASDNFGWLKFKSVLWSRYRLRAVFVSFQKLGDVDHAAALAIYWSMICPWDRYDARREDVERGLLFMADEIPDELPIYGETKPEMARRLYREGFSRDEITRAAHMSARDVSRAVKQEKRGRRRKKR